MSNRDDITNKDNKEHNEKWSYISDHPYRIMIIGGFRLRKTKALINLINEQDYIDKIYLYAKDLSKPQYQFLIKKQVYARIKHYNDPNVFIECFNFMDDIPWMTYFNWSFLYITKCLI